MYICVCVSVCMYALVEQIVSFFYHIVFSFCDTPPI